MSELIVIPMDKLVLSHSNIGVHRGRKFGFRDIFGYHTLFNVPFLRLAKKVKAAYLGEKGSSHKGWPAQQSQLKWFVDEGVEGLYQKFGQDPIKVYPASKGTFYVDEGNHRSLALYIMGQDHVRAVVTSKAPRAMRPIALGQRRMMTGTVVMRPMRPRR